MGVAEVGSGAAEGGEEMSDERKRQHAWGWPTAAIVILPLLYALSIGPVSWFEMRRGGLKAGSWFYPFYTPLICVRDVSPKPVANAYWWYLGLWVPVTPPLELR